MDDLGHYNVELNNPEIRTPHLVDFRANGLLLDRHYTYKCVQPHRAPCRRAAPSPLPSGSAEPELAAAPATGHGSVRSAAARAHAHAHQPLT